jgi:hypothetical protein
MSAAPIKLSNGRSVVDPNFRDRPPPGFTAPKRVARPDAPFDYGDLAPDLANEAKATASRIRHRLRDSIIETGRDLIAMKAKLGHGFFLPWLEGELGIGERSAQRYMRVANLVHGKSDKVSDLPATILYLLSSESAPAEAVQEIIAPVEAGERPKVDDVREQLSEATAAEKKAKAVKTTEELKRDKENEKRRREAQAKRDRESEERSRQNEQARQDRANIVALMLFERLGSDGVHELLAALENAEWPLVEKSFGGGLIRSGRLYIPSAEEIEVRCADLERQAESRQGDQAGSTE